MGAKNVYTAHPPKRASRWPVAFLLSAAAIPVILFVGLSTYEFRTNWQQTERELARSADATAEYSLRILEAHRLAADRVNDLLRGLSDSEIRAREHELHQRLRALIPSLPLVQTVAVLDRGGYLLLTANVFPVPRDRDFKDREWVRDLSKPDARFTHISKVNIGRLDGFLFFGVSRRRSGSGNGLPDDAFDGVINISVQPNHMSSGFGDLTTEASDVVAVVRTDGEILARNPGFEKPLPPIPRESDYIREISAGLGRGIMRGVSPVDGVDRLVAFRKVSGYPIYALVARDTAVVVGRWKERLATELLFGGPAILLFWALVALAFRDTRRVKDAQLKLAREQAQRAAEANFRAVFDSGVVGMAILNFDGSAVAVNDRLLVMTGHTRDRLVAGQWSWSAVMAPEFREADKSAIDKVRQDRGSESYEKDLVRADGSRLPVRVFASHLPGSPGHVVVAVEDISKHREAEARRDLMAREVEHRAKNMLAMIQASVRLGAETTSDSHALAAAVDGRIGALGRVQSLLTESAWLDADMATLIGKELAAFRTDADGSAPSRCIIEGQVLRLPAAVAQSLSMVIHELATNAIKYGAFSVPQGRVIVKWSITSHDSPMICLSWIEENGPGLLAPPTRRGFGTMLINTVVQSHLNGTVAKRWEPGGLLCDIRIEVPFSRSEPPGEQGAARRSA
jgi:PAS domain S-box-containing protein